jgi:transmembrane sensor
MVTHDAQRPFEVNASHGTARALGTQFNVLATAQGATVSVLSGKVEVIAPDTAETSGSQSAVLGHGQQITYTGGSLSPVQAANARRIGAWHSGRIAFEDVELEQALTEFNRYGKTPIVLGDTSLARLRVSGVFRIGETDAFLRALSTAFDIDAAHRGGTVELRARETD